MAKTEMGDFIRHERLRRNLTQHGMKAVTGWDQAKVSKLETNFSKPTLDDLETLSRVSGVSMIRLLRMRRTTQVRTKRIRRAA